MVCYQQLNIAVRVWVFFNRTRQPGDVVYLDDIMEVNESQWVNRSSPAALFTSPWLFVFELSPLQHVKLKHSSLTSRSFMILHSSTGCFWVWHCLSVLTDTLLDSRGGLSEAGVCQAPRPGACRSGGDVEEILPGGVWAAQLRAQGVTMGQTSLSSQQQKDWTQSLYLKTKKCACGCINPYSVS